MRKIESIDLNVIKEKVKDSNCLGETKEKLTKEELVTITVGQKELESDLWLRDGDEYLILQILQMLSDQNCSMRYVMYLLDTVKELLPRVCVFKL